MEFATGLQLAAVSAVAALAIGGAAALFGHGPVLGTLARLAAFALRRRHLTTLALGGLASGGIAAANAAGLEPAAAGDAVAWFQDRVALWTIS